MVPTLPSPKRIEMALPDPIRDDFAAAAGSENVSVMGDPAYTVWGDATSLAEVLCASAGTPMQSASATAMPICRISDLHIYPQTQYRRGI